MHQLGQLLAQQIHSIFHRGLNLHIPNGEWGWALFYVLICLLHIFHEVSVQVFATLPFLIQGPTTYSSTLTCGDPPASAS